MYRLQTSWPYTSLIDCSLCMLQESIFWRRNIRFWLFLKNMSILAALISKKSDERAYIRITNLCITLNTFDSSDICWKGVLKNSAKIESDGLYSFNVWKPFFFPMVLNADVVSQPLNAWKNGIAWQSCCPNLSTKGPIWTVNWFFFKTFWKTILVKSYCALSLGKIYHQYICIWTYYAYVF